MTTYDNTNKGSLWAPENPNNPATATGKVNYDGTEYVCTLYKLHNGGGLLLLKESWDTDGISELITLFPPKKQSAKILGGSNDEYWFSVFVNDSDNPKAPDLNISIQVKED